MTNNVLMSVLPSIVTPGFLGETAENDSFDLTLRYTNKVGVAMKEDEYIPDHSLRNVDDGVHCNGGSV